MTDAENKTQDTNAQETQVVHKSIAAAIASAVREVRVIGKGDRNKFDGYDFASIDKFLMLVNPICGRNGLFPIVAQREVEFYENVNSKGGKSVWARFFYDVTMYHETGETLGPINMMVAVPMNGAQSSGSAQSYALKQFFRAMLMIPTGDKDDADLNPTETHQSVTTGQNRPSFDSGATKARLIASIEAQTTKEGLLSLWNGEADALKAITDEHYEQVKAARDAKGISFSAPKNDDLGGDSLPYEGPSQ